MSDGEGDLFADSDDTAELINNSKPEPKKAAKKKLGAAAKRKRKADVPDADADSDKEDLFDSDDDDDAPKKPAGKKAKPMSKKERMEALQKKKRAADDKVVSSVPKEGKKKPAREGADDASEESYDSRDFQLNEDDRNFIDTEGDDAEAINELYAEQKFDDDNEAMEDDSELMRKKKKGGGSRSSSGNRSRSEKLDPEKDLDNPIMAAVHRMKKKKHEKRSLTDLEDDAKKFLEQMERAAEADEQSVKERRPATKKLKLLETVVEMFTKREMTRVLLDLDVLSICRRWIQPLPNGTLGNVTIRQRLVESIANMNEIGPNDLKRSEFGKVIMSLYMHKSETPAMKRQLKALIEQWSRPIFQKSGNMRDLERVQVSRGGEGGLSSIARQQMQDQRRMESAAKGSGGKKDIESMIKSGKGKGGGSGLNRVRVPYSKGFQYTVRPTARTTQSPGEKGGKDTGVRDNLKKRMMEKGRAVSKNQRSANISVEGRASKG